MNIKKIGEISTQIRGVSYGKHDARNSPANNYIPIVRANNIQNYNLDLNDLVYVPISKVSDKQKMRQGDIVIAASSGSIDIVGKANSIKTDMDMSFGAFCKILRPDLDVVDERYFANYFSTQKYRKIISSLAAGANINNLRNEHLDNLEIPLPPLPEQKRIAQILDKADELRQKRQQSIEKLDELLQATFIDMFGDPVTNPNKHKTDILANYVLKDFQNGLYKPASFYGSGTPILRIDGYRNGDIINESNFKRLELEPSEIEKYKLTKMDLVINRVNSPEYLGKIALFMDDREDTVFESNMMRFSIRQELLNVYYLIFLFKQRYISNQIATKRKDAVNQSSINQQDVKSLILNVPNIKLQNKWAELYQSCNMQKKILTSQLNQQETLFQSLQQRAFNGEL